MLTLWPVSFSNCCANPSIASFIAVVIRALISADRAGPLTVSSASAATAMSIRMTIPPVVPNLVRALLLPHLHPLRLDDRHRLRRGEEMDQGVGALGIRGGGWEAGRGNGLPLYIPS